MTTKTDEQLIFDVLSNYSEKTRFIDDTQKIIYFNNYLIKEITVYISLYYNNKKALTRLASYIYLTLMDIDIELLYINMDDMVLKHKNDKIIENNDRFKCLTNIIMAIDGLKNIDHDKTNNKTGGNGDDNVNGVNGVIGVNGDDGLKNIDHDKTNKTGGNGDDNVNGVNGVIGVNGDDGLLELMKVNGVDSLLELMS